MQCSGGDLREILCIIADIAGLGITLAFSAALLLFFWGVAVFMFSAGDSKARSEGKYRIFWGVIIMFILGTVWGLVRILRQTFFG
jgi:hypothetical protein